MPLVLSDIAIEEKNKLATDSNFLPFVELQIPGVDDNPCIVRNNEDIVWAGKTWYAFPFEMDDVVLTAKGEVPQLSIRVSNVNQVMESYIQLYDQYCKLYGYSPVVIWLHVLNTRAIAADAYCASENTFEFELKQPKTSPKWATFILGASSPYKRRAPQSRILKNHCRFRFKDSRCKYIGTGVSCNKTLTQCRLYSNSVNFGGFPGVGYGGIVVTQS
jgi:phage-related protein